MTTAKLINDPMRDTTTIFGDLLDDAANGKEYSVFATLGDYWEALTHGAEFPDLS